MTTLNCGQLTFWDRIWDFQDKGDNGIDRTRKCSFSKCEMTVESKSAPARWGRYRPEFSMR